MKNFSHELEREVYASMDKKNWVFIYTRLAGKYYNISNKQVDWVKAHTPTLFFDFAKIIDRDANGKIVNEEIRELK